MSRVLLRRRALRGIIENRSVASQDDLRKLLARRGFQVTQATVSRDLRALGAFKTRARDGLHHYAITSHTPPGPDREALKVTLSVYVMSVSTSENLVVVTTPPGAAQVVAAAIDLAEWEGVLGTVAGDDTVLVVAAAETGGDAVAELIRQVGAVE